MPSPLLTFTDYLYYYDLTVPAVASGAEVAVAMNNLTRLKAEGLVRDDLKDFRVAYWNGSTWAQIGRDVTGSTVSFAAQTTHAAQTVGTYVIYFGYATESTTPTSYTPTYWDDFEDASIDTSKWATSTNSTGAVSESSGMLHIDAPTGNDDAAIAVMKPAIASGFDKTFRIRWDTWADGWTGIHIRESSTTPVCAATATINTQLALAVVAYNNTLYLGKDDTTRTHTNVNEFWNFATGGWSTSVTTTAVALDTWYQIRISFDSTNGWRIRVYTDSGSLLTANADTGYFNDVYDSTGDYWLAVGDPYNDYAAGAAIELDWVKDTPASASTPTYKRNAGKSESKTLDSSQTTNATYDQGYGADQATGRQCAIKFTPTETAEYQYFEVLCRQAGATPIQAHDITFEVQTDSSGRPSGTVVGRGVITSLGIEKSTGSYQWLPVYIPSKMVLTGGTAYHLVPFVNGAGSGTQAINFAAALTGSTMSVRTRSASTWGAWAASGNLGGCIKVYKGWFGYPANARVSVETRDGTAVAVPNNVPSWEADYSADGLPTDSEATYVTEAWYDDAADEWRAVYCAYSNGADADSAFFAGMGAMYGSTLTTMTKFNQDPLTAIAASGHTAFNWTPSIYDKTAGAMAGYFRTKTTATGAVQRELRHMTNTHANWYQPSTGGGWTVDGKVTVPFPEPGNIIAPKAWKVGDTVYVQICCELVDGGGRARMLICEKDTATSLKNAKPVWFDTTDIDPTNLLASAVIGGTQRTSDDVYHSLITEQKALTGDSAGGYYFRGWCADSLDHYVYSPPYLLLDRQSSIASEYLGVEVAGAAGLVSDTDLLYGGISRYGPTTNPKVVGQTNIATVDIGLTPAIPSGSMFQFHDFDGGLN